MRKIFIVFYLMMLFAASAVADNIKVTEGADKDVGFDTISSVNYQRIKLIYGVDGSNSGDVASNNPLPMQIRSSGGTELGTSTNPLQCTLANTGANGTAINVAIASAIPAGSNSIGSVTCNAGTNLNTALLATSSNQSTIIGYLDELTEQSDKCGNYTFISTSAVQAAQIKGSAGSVCDIQCFNKNASTVFVRLYNKTGTPGTGDSSSIAWRGFVPGNANASGFSVPFPKERTFSTGIGIRVTASGADNDATALTSGDVVCNVGYK